MNVFANSWQINPVAGSAKRANDPVFLIAELLAQGSDINLHDVVLSAKVIIPHNIQNVWFTQNSAVFGHKQFSDLYSVGTAQVPPLGMQFLSCGHRW